PAKAGTQFTSPEQMILDSRLRGNERESGSIPVTNTQMDREPIERAEALLDLCRRKKLKVAAAESCTGGLLAATLTEIAASSGVFEGGLAPYSNAAKQAVLGGGADTLERHGAVSREPARAMAQGALARSPVELAVSITGIAGPSGATPSKPVGLVYLAAAA